MGRDIIGQKKAAPAAVSAQNIPKGGSALGNEGEIAMVTGANEGVGFEIFLLLARRGGHFSYGEDQDKGEGGLRFIAERGHTRSLAPPGRG